MHASTRRRTLAVLTTAATALAGAQAASAAPPPSRWGCEAQPLEASLVGFDLVAPLGLLTANGARTPCADDEAPLDALNDALTVLRPAGIDLAAVEAVTTITPDTGAAVDQSVSARAKVTDLDVSLLGLTELVGVDVAEARAAGSCVNGAPVLTGGSDIGDVRVAGRPIADLDEPVTITGNIVNGLLPGTVVKLEPNLELKAGGTLTRVALRVRVLTAGVSVLQLDVGRAIVSSAQVRCAQDAPAVAVVDSGVNRIVAATVTPAPGRTIASCAFALTPAAGGDPISLTGTYDPDTGGCRAGLPRDSVPVGDYDVAATAIDDLGQEGTALGAVSVAAPGVGTPQIDGRIVSAPLTPAPGAPITACTVTVTPAGGTSTELAGTIGNGTCRAALPDATPSGEATIVVTATDENGDTGSGSSTGQIGPVPLGPGVVLIDSGENRQVVATVADGSNGPATACTVKVRKAGSSDPYVTLASTLADGRCSALLPPEQFPAGQSYDIDVSATDRTDRSGEAMGTKAIGRPQVGAPAASGGFVSAEVTAPVGTAITGCTMTIRTAGPPPGAPQELDARFDEAGATCSAAVPAGLAFGSYLIDVTATNDDGDTGDGSVTRTLGTASTPPPTGTTPTGGSTPPVTGGGTTSPATGSTPAPSSPSTVSGAGVAGPPDFATAGASELLLGCAADKLVLSDVRMRGSRVRLAGAADRSLVGQRVSLLFSGSGKRVATAMVKADGTFSASAPRPARSVLTKSTTKYQAVLGETVSRRLKLARRVEVTTAKAGTRRVTFRGRTGAPIARTGTVTTLQQLVSCGRYRTVARTKTDRRGRFAFSVTKPTAQTAIYRVRTVVPNAKRPRTRSNRTYSLPTPVDLR